MERTPETCEHEQSCHHAESKEQLEQVGWGFKCPDPPRGCGLIAYGPTPDAARKAFARKNEKIKVEALLRRRGKGERLTDTQNQMIAYSPYGTASRCGY